MIRILDIIISLVSLIMLSPFLLFITIYLKFTGEGEIFYLQNRIGINGKEFKLIKFATMLKNSSQIRTGTITVHNDSRILPSAKFLRDLKINELPQLINVFIGNMSLIGPRPLTLQTFNLYSSNAQNIIKTVKPGLSGIGSVIFRNEERILNSKFSILQYNNLISPYKEKLEIWYIENNSFYIYISCICLTIWVIIFPKSKIIWKLYKTLPQPSDELKKILSC